MTNNQYRIFNKIVKREKVQNVIQDKVNIKELYKLNYVDSFTMRQISFFSSFCLMNKDSYHDFFREHDNSENSIQHCLISLKNYFTAKYYSKHKFLWFSELYADYQSIFVEFYLWLKYLVIPQLK